MYEVHVPGRVQQECVCVRKWRWAVWSVSGLYRSMTTSCLLSSLLIKVAGQKWGGRRDGISLSTWASGRFSCSPRYSRDPAMPIPRSSWTSACPPALSPVWRSRSGSSSIWSHHTCRRQHAGTRGRTASWKFGMLLSAPYRPAGTPGHIPIAGPSYLIERLSIKKQANGVTEQQRFTFILDVPWLTRRWRICRFSMTLQMTLFSPHEYKRNTSGGRAASAFFFCKTDLLKEPFISFYSDMRVMRLVYSRALEKWVIMTL